MSEPYAIRIHETGGPDVLKKEAFEPKQPGPGQALVRQTAVGLNFIDTYYRTGLYPVKFPFTPGSEGAGVVEAVGEGVTHVKPGDRVGYVASGTYATHLTAPAGSLIKLPDGIADEDAAAVMLKGLTAWMLLFEIRPVQKGDTLLVWAPVGGVGSLLVPWAASLGARVIAVTSSEKKAELARASGASDVIVGYDNVAEQVKALTDGKGVDMALDSVGKVSFEASLSSLKKRGWMVSYGNASGMADPVPPGRLAQGGSLILTRPTLFSFIDTPEALARGASLLFSALQDGTLKAEIGQRFALKDVGDAHRALESGKTTGATILVP
jgi:NADPH:quinone reductase